MLLVEDDDSAREIFAKALRMTGYQVRTAADGLAGLRLLEVFEPDVVVLDLVLPIASGSKYSTSCARSSALTMFP